MSAVTARRWLRDAMGLLLGFAIGLLCRAMDIPSPAPPVLAGALLVFAMTAGYVVTDRWRRRKDGPARDDP